MYYEHFGLHYPPFKITPDPQLFYSGGKRGLVLEALLYAIQTGEGIIKVVGEVGSGKTMLCRMLEEKLSKQGVEIVYLVNPHLTPEMVLQAIAFELKLPLPADNLPLATMHQLNHYLIEKHKKNQRVVIFIEEAQGMQLETLEEIRLLSNLETTRDKLLQIVLFGQPELDQHLALPHIRQLRERITHHFYLTGLTRTQIQEYLHFRLQAVGYRGAPVFTPAAVRKLSLISQGLMRRINILADKALLAAFAENTHTVTSRHITLAARDSGLPTHPFTSWAQIATLSLLILLGCAIWLTEPLTHWLSAWEQNITFVNPSTAAPTKALPTLLDPLEPYFTATERWLTQTQPNAYCLQVMQIPEEKAEEVIRLLRKTEIQPFLTQLHVFRSTAKPPPTIGLVYGTFNDETTAIAAIEGLPESLKRNRPFVRRIDTLMGNRGQEK